MLRARIQTDGFTLIVGIWHELHEQGDNSQDLGPYLSLKIFIEIL